MVSNLNSKLNVPSTNIASGKLSPINLYISFQGKDFLLTLLYDNTEHYQLVRNMCEGTNDIRALYVSPTPLILILKIHETNFII